MAQKQITKEQHYAPRFYFKSFATKDNFLETLDIQQGKIIKRRPYSGVCYADYYYSLKTGEADDISQEFENFFSSIENQYAKAAPDIIKRIINNEQLLSEDLDIIAWFMASLWVRNPMMRKRLNNMNEEMTKKTMQISSSHPGFKDYVKRIFEEKGENISEDAINTSIEFFRTGDYEITPATNYSHLVFIEDCMLYKNWFLAKSFRFYIAKGNNCFITSDVPVIEVFPEKRGIYGAHIMERKQTLPMSPNILVELVNPLKNRKKVKRKSIYDLEVTKLNLEHLNNSTNYCYATERPELEELLKYDFRKKTAEIIVKNYLSGKNT